MMNLAPVALFLLTLTYPLRTEAQRVAFDMDQDLLLAQFDGRPDADDIHSQAALGCLLADPHFANVKTYGVMNAYGRQSKNSLIWDSSTLMDLVFSPSPRGENWWIFELGSDGDTLPKFWELHVVSTPSAAF